MKKVFLVFAFISIIVPLGLFWLMVWVYEVPVWEILASGGPLKNIWFALGRTGLFVSAYPLGLIVFFAALWKHPFLKAVQKGTLTVLTLILGLPCAFSLYLYLTWDYDRGKEAS